MKTFTAISILSVFKNWKRQVQFSRRDVYIRETVVILTGEFFIAEKQQFFFLFKCLEITDEKSNFYVQRENVRNINGHTI